MLHIEALTRTFVKDGREIHVLAGVDLTIEPGESVSIMGRSGAGKTTFLQVVGTLDRPTSGTVRFEGRDVFAMNDAELSAFRGRSIGFMFQFHHLLPDFTTLENAAMPAIIARLPRAEALDRAAAVLRRVGLGDRLTHRPGELSGGEQQRVALARAVVMQPRLVLADEPTGNLDRETADGVFELMLELARRQGTAFVLVTHDEGFARRCDRMLRLRRGVLVAPD